jgi:hypothetical protein
MQTTPKMMKDEKQPKKKECKKKYDKMSSNSKGVKKHTRNTKLLNMKDFLF